ncbi:hypothetical protein BGZ94_004811 [Podila epigama]|nr:hypothetical protein BGZ94_004811 [Podila epigama]
MISLLQTCVKDAVTTSLHEWASDTGQGGEMMVRQAVEKQVEAMRTSFDIVAHEQQAQISECKTTLQDLVAAVQKQTSATAQEANKLGSLKQELLSSIVESLRAESCLQHQESNANFDKLSEQLLGIQTCFLEHVQKSVPPSEPRSLCHQGVCIGVSEQEAVTEACHHVLQDPQSGQGTHLRDIEKLFHRLELRLENFVAPRLLECDQSWQDFVGRQQGLIRQLSAQDETLASILEQISTFKASLMTQGNTNEGQLDQLSVQLSSLKRHIENQSLDKEANLVFDARNDFDNRTVSEQDMLKMFQVIAKVCFKIIAWHYRRVRFWIFWNEEALASAMSNYNLVKSTTTSLLQGSDPTL